MLELQAAKKIDKNIFWVACNAFRFINQKNGGNMCLDWHYGSGKSVGVWACNNGASQRWHWSGSFLRSVKDSKKCLNWDTNGEDVNVQTCHETANQKWVMESANLVSSKLDRRMCLDWSFSHGKNVTMAWCNETSDNQQWVQSST